MAVMVFNNEHIWCIKNYNNTWFKLDSVSGKPEPVQFRHIFSRQGFGWIIVWNRNKSESNVVQPINVDSTSKVSDTVVVNQPSKSRSKQSSKRSRIEEEIVFDEYLSIFERDESTPSNRFEVLSPTEE